MLFDSYDDQVDMLLIEEAHHVCSSIKKTYFARALDFNIWRTDFIYCRVQIMYCAVYA
jgi:hypothetical protein